ncbi:MAG: tetratricopeptide repeat protein [Tepidisphaerales bacterium]
MPRAAGEPVAMTVQQALDLALKHHHAKNYVEAERIYRQILAQQPNNPDALHLLGMIAHLHQRNDLARDLVSRATQLAPNVAPYWNTLGEIHRVSGRLDLAYHCYHKALRYHRDMPEALNNLGILHAYRCELDKSIECFERAIALRPDYPEAHDGLGLTLLLAGQLRRGWAEQEWRWRKEVMANARRHFKQPMWQGPVSGSLAGKRLLVHAEQGFGDVIQMCRYLPRLKREHRTHLIFEVQPELETLMRTLEGVDELVVRTSPHDAHLPPFDLHCPVMSLPLVLGTDLDTIPAEVPYLSAEPAKVEAWRQRLATLGDDSLKVGVVWAGRPTHARDATRSMHLSTLAPLAAVPGVRLVSLQKGEAARQVRQCPNVIAMDVADDLHDFADTAAAVAALDVVVSVDTSVVHLAGSLARPVVVLLPFSPDWRWLLGRSDSPWYPTARLLRQRIDGVWADPVAEACTLLSDRGWLTSRAAR